MVLTSQCTLAEMTAKESLSGPKDTPTDNINSIQNVTGFQPENLARQFLGAFCVKCRLSNGGKVCFLSNEKLSKILMLAVLDASTSMPRTSMPAQACPAYVLFMQLISQVLGENY